MGTHHRSVLLPGPAASRLGSLGRRRSVQFPRPAASRSGSLDRRRSVAVVAVAALALSACNGDDAPAVETAVVGTAEVVETVAGAAELVPAGRVPVTAPAGGEIVELAVDDGDEVEEGDLLLRLSSEGIDQQIAQAEAALTSADAMSGIDAAGMDISPLFGAVRGQLEVVLPPLLDGLAQQAADIEDDETRQALEDSLAEARSSYDESVAELREAEQSSRSQVEEAEAAQRQAADAQREQARLALDAAEAQQDELAIYASADGVVELGQAGDAAGGLGALGGMGALGELEAEGLDDLGGLDGMGEAAPADEDAPTISSGAEVSAGQTVLTIYDLSSFSAQVQVDEIDIVDVDEGQRVTVLVDAFPDAELDGHVEHVAISPEGGAGGGATFPVRVALTSVPDEVRLRVGLTASTEIVVREVEGDTVVPSSALLRQGRDDLIRVVREGVVHDVSVSVDALGEQQAAVTGELEEGERVVTTGVDQVAEGDEVEE